MKKANVNKVYLINCANSMLADICKVQNVHCFHLWLSNLQCWLLKEYINLFRNFNNTSSINTWGKYTGRWMHTTRSLLHNLYKKKYEKGIHMKYGHNHVCFGITQWIICLQIQITYGQAANGKISFQMLQQANGLKKWQRNTWYCTTRQWKNITTPQQNCYKQQLCII